MANSAADIQKLYIAYFNRPADPAGLEYWMASTASLTTIAKSFADQPEYVKAYAGQSTLEVISTIYKNLFGSDRVVDAAGLLYWNGQVASGKLTMGEVAISILGGATGADKTAVESKVVAATSFTTALDTAAEMVAYSKTGGTDLAKSWLGSVTTAATATSQIATQDAVIKAMVDGTVSSNALTNGTDILSGSNFSAPQVYTPGGDDRINSLQDEDQLTGTGTNNVLTATLGNANDNGATTITPKLNNIQVINASFTGSGGTAVTDLDMQDATGTKEVNISRVSSTSNTARIENIQAVVEKMSVANSNANAAGTIEFSYGTDVLKGANTGMLNLSNVQVASVNIGENTSGTGASGVGVNGYEDITINSTGSKNTVATFNLPMDTGTDGKITITGDKDLNIASQTIINSVTVANNIEALQFGGGFALANGRLATVDASAFTGNLTLNMGSGFFTTGKADTSGAKQNVTVTGGKGNDHFILQDTIEAGDKLAGGDGVDTLTVLGGTINSTSSVVTGVEKLNMFMNGVSSTVDFSKLPDVVDSTVRNIGNNGTSGVFAGAVTATLSKMTAAQATGITILHSTTGNGDITSTTLVAGLKDASGTSDTVGLTIKDGVNTDGRFNFTLKAAGAENITIADSDTESNMIEMGTVADHKGTITVTGGLAGTKINFDVDTAAAAGTTTGLNRQNVGGSIPLNPNGSGNADVSTVATQVKFQSAVFDASGEASDVIARFDTFLGAANGGQKVMTGSGNDTVIFDKINDNRAGLTISDTVDGGAGIDTLVIDGHLAGAGTIALAASEWTNVSNFENIKVVGAGLAGNKYKLTLTDSLISKNNDAGVLTIINDNDSANEGDNSADTAGTGQESAIIIDARSLNNTSRFAYNGEEGNTRTADRIIMSDVNVNGSHNIDGGVVDQDGVIYTANADVLEIRNSAVATAGDLANIQNIGTIAFNNDQAVVQTLVLELNDEVVEAMVSSAHTATATEVEVLNIVVNDGVGVASVAGSILQLDASQLSSKFALNVTLDAGFLTNDTISLSTSSPMTMLNFVATDDQLQLSKSLFTALTSIAGNGFSVVAELNLGAAAVSNTSAGIIKVDTTGVDSKVYYDADGVGTGSAILIATLTGTTLTAADFDLVS